MATAITFKLKAPQKGISPSKQKETPVNMFFNFGYFENTPKGKKYIPLKYATGEKITPCFWNDKPTYRAKQTSKFDYENFNTRLENIENAAKKVYREMQNAEEAITPETLRVKLDIELGEKEIQTETTENFNTYIDRFIKDMEAGKRLTEKGEIYKLGTLKNFKGFQTQFNSFQEEINRKLNFEDITIDFYDEFTAYFNRKNYSPNTIGRHIKNLKTIMRAAREEGLHTNFEIDRKKFKTLKTEVKNVYLTESEVKAIAKLDLSDRKTYDEARDVFMVGCYTAQRFSDYSRISKEHIRTLDNGARVIDLIQMKTGERVIIPIRPELLTILEKYDYTLPKTYEQKVNSRIKEVAKKAKITELVQIEATKGGLRINTTKAKCDLIKTHTARRTACTNMYLAGIPTIDIMKISGHKTEREFLNYIKVSKEETAASLSSHPYFNQSTMKIAK